jgi:hypothetical protein
MHEHVVRAVTSCAEGAGDERTQEGPFTLRQANQGTHAQIFYLLLVLPVTFYQTSHSLEILWKYSIVNAKNFRIFGKEKLQYLKT